VSAERDELDEAHRLLKEQAERYGVTTIHDLYFKKDDGEEGLSIGALRNVVRENPHGKAAETKAAVLKFSRTILAEKDEEGKARLYHILGKLFNVGPQSRAANYVGTYSCYRIQTGTENSKSPELLLGKIRIKPVPADNSYWFDHTSLNSSHEAEDAPIEHKGPFFVLENRVYLVGWGVDRYGAYMRPIIFQTSATPETVPLRGIVLTESADGNIPVAARTILYHDELHKRMEEKHGSAMGEYVLSQLRVPATNPSVPEGEPVSATNLLGW
jgi:hypothetical protein